MALSSNGLLLSSLNRPLKLSKVVELSSDEEVKDELLSVDNSSKFTVFNSGSGVFRTGDSTGVSMVPNLIS